MTTATASSVTKNPKTANRLTMQAVSKRFPGVLANDNISFVLRPGEVHALLGENGAGKTTLMNILYGLYQADSGSIYVDGQPVHFRSPKDAMRQGIGLVAQHFHLARRHSVAENIALGLPGIPFFYPVKGLEQRIRTLGASYGLSVDPRAKIWQLSPGEQQRVEILKALIQGAKILILDEPTSVLTPQESESLFAVLRRMKSEGESVIFISHKLDEVMEIADHITVLRKGAVVASLDKHEASAESLAQHMMGKAVSPLRSKTKPPQAKVALELKNVWVKNSRGLDALKGISFRLHQGEILGVAGVAGNGQAELIEVLTGLQQAGEGEIVLDGKDSSRLGVKGFFEAGVAHIPEDRNHMGVVANMTVAENLVLRHYRYPPFSRWGLLDWQQVTQFAQTSIKDYEIATPSKDTLTRLLSGGNVQKLILARELAGEPKLVIAAHPSYGLDVSATAMTHDLLLKQRERGAGVLLVSEDLDELLKLADRIAVLFHGQLMGIVDALVTSREAIGLLMAGRKAQV